MLSSAQNIEDLVEALEVTFLANRDERLHFGLLTDFQDAQQESLPEDAPLLQLAQARIEELNAKYDAAESRSKDDIFFLFHRPRRWNPRERLWMGYERKRGKLADLNALLRGGSEDRFSLVVGDIALLSEVKYVITLDTDTQLPRDAARQFVGAMAHPLNRPRYDETKRRVVEGYGILQPRVAVSLPGTNRSRYARLYGGEPGIDPYTRAVSDVYQDVFGEGSFIGKGIYDVDAFEQALGGRFPENRILSHDLLEGCYARAGLLSDVQLYEDYPARYSADVSRRHRWIRGDWQLAAWLLPAGSGQEGAAAQEPALAAVAMEDLRQPAAQPGAGGADAAVAAGLDGPAAGLALDPGGDRHRADSAACRLDRSTCCASPTRCCCGSTSPRVALCRAALRAGGIRARLPAVRGVLQPGRDRAHDLAHAGHAQTDCSNGIPRARTASRPTQPQRPRRLFALDVDRARHRRCGGVDLAAATPAALALAAPILLLWLASPAIAWWISRPLARRKAPLTPEQTRFLRDACAQDLGILRDLRRPGRSLAAAGQLSGASARPCSRTAPRRPTWGCRCWRTCPPTTSATCRPDG